MALIRWNPNRELGSFPSDILSMQREINRMFNTFFHGSEAEDTALLPSTWSPATDIAEHEGEYVVKIELPGVNKDDVKITMEENVLTIRGEKKQEKETKNSNFHRVERSYGAFQRCFTLPTNVRADKVDASFDNGMLSIVLPKSEESKPKQIDVKVK